MPTKSPMVQPKSNFITLKRKRRRIKYSKTELDSDSENSSLELDLRFDAKFRAPNPNNAMMNARRKMRAMQEPLIQKSAAENKLHQIKQNTKTIVKDIIDSAMPSIINNEQVQKILEQENLIKMQQTKQTQAMQAELKKIKTQMKSGFLQLNANLKQIYELLAPTAITPKKRKLNSFTQKFQPEDEDFDWL